MSDLQELGRRMAALQDRRLAALQESAGSVPPGLGEHLVRRARARRRNRHVVLAGATMLLVAGAIGGVRLWPRPDRGGIATVPARAGQRVEASLRDVGLVFDDGSRALLARGASVRTEMIGPASASLELERGRVSLRVVHGKATHFTVRAGDYAVSVTGTRFSVDWRPDNRAFLVAVQEGSVRVSGGLLTQAIDVRAGQSLVLDHGHPVAAPAPPVMPAAPTAPVPAQQTRAPEIAPASPAESELSDAPKRPSARHASLPTWQDQAEAGRYREALAEAERKGFDGICREASGLDLLSLAEAARYAGRADRADQALKAVRARFARGENAATAAYLLGRIAAESRRDYVDAARWFRTYLAERPDGRLTREAEGRLLESLAFMDREPARGAARAYLEHYPTGPHAAFARNLLGI
jgi:transmembrane sensor